MSEEEIIKNLNELISWKGKNVEIRDYEIEAIQGLLDIYNKEKEKNKELKKKLEEYRIGWCNEGEKSEKLYKEIRKLQELLGEE